MLTGWWQLCFPLWWRLLDNFAISNQSGIGFSYFNTKYLSLFLDTCVFLSVLFPFLIFTSMSFCLSRFKACCQYASCIKKSMIVSDPVRMWNLLLYEEILISIIFSFFSFPSSFHFSHFLWYLFLFLTPFAYSSSIPFFFLLILFLSFVFSFSSLFPLSPPYLSHIFVCSPSFSLSSSSHLSHFVSGIRQF